MLAIIINCILFPFPVLSSLAPHNFSSGQEMSGLSCCQVIASLKLVLAMNLWLIWQQPNVILEVLFWGLCLRLPPSFPICFTFYVSLVPYILLFIFPAKIVFRDISLLALVGWGPRCPEICFLYNPPYALRIQSQVCEPVIFLRESRGKFLLA